MKYRACRHFYGCDLEGTSLYVPFAEYVDARYAGESPDKIIKKGLNTDERIVINYKKKTCIVPYKIFIKYFKGYGRT